MNGKREKLLARCALFTAAIIWGTSFFMVKNSVDVFPPAMLLAIRFSIATLLLGALFFRRLRTMPRAQVLRSACVGAFLAAAALFQAVGITGTSPGKNAFLTAIYCVLTPFIFWMVIRKRPALRSFVAASVCLAGIGLVSLTESMNVEWGDALTLVGGVLYACHIVATATLGKDVDPVNLTVMQFASAAVICWLYSLCFETMTGVVKMENIITVLYLAILPTASGFFLQTYGQRRASPQAASLILSLESVFGVLFSVIFYGEQLTGRLVVGFVVIFISVLISEVEWKPHRLQKKSVTAS